MTRPFAVRYNPYTESVEILDNSDSVSPCLYRVVGPLTM